MPNTRTAALIAVLVAVASAAMPVAASANTPGCVTKAEYRSAHSGYTMTRVHRNWDTSGHRVSLAQSGGYAASVRTYRTCGSRYGSVAVAWDKKPGGAWRLSAKSAVWVY